MPRSVIHDNNSVMVTRNPFANSFNMCLRSFFADRIDYYGFSSISVRAYSPVNIVAFKTHVLIDPYTFSFLTPNSCQTSLLAYTAFVLKPHVYALPRMLLLNPLKSLRDFFLKASCIASSDFGCLCLPVFQLNFNPFSSYHIPDSPIRILCSFSK